MTRTRIAVIITVSAILAWIYWVNPENPESAYLKCPFHWLTGLQCPLCGAQRAVHCLLHLQIEKAWWYNPWLLPMAVYSIVYYTGRWRSKIATITMLALTLAWGITRNIINI